MAIKTSNWLIISDVAHEAAFRVDVPEPQRGMWVLSYLPTSRRLTREQAVAGVLLAELILVGLLRPGGDFDHEMAVLHAGILGITVIDAMCLLALRVGPEESEALRPKVSRPERGELNRREMVHDRFCGGVGTRREVSR